MTTYYVSDTGDNGAGTSWATAKTTLAGAIALATASGDVILVDKDHTGDSALAANTTWTALNNISIICVDKDASDALAEMGEAAWLGSSSTHLALVFAGAYRVKMYGLTFRTAGLTSAAKLSVSTSDGSHFEIENCLFWNGTTSSAAYNVFGAISQANSYTKLTNCTMRYGATGQTAQLYGRNEWTGCRVSSAGSTPTRLFSDGGRGGSFLGIDCDFSLIGSGIICPSAPNQVFTYEFARCKFGSNYVLLDTQAPANLGSATALSIDCSSDDTHGIMHYANAFGSVVSDAGIYYTTGAAAQSWKVTTTANCSPATPFVTPWIAAYHSGVSSITPCLEILRDGSATAYQDDEVWSEWSAKVTSGTVLGTSYSDGMPLLGTPANQAAGAGTGAWTGENATAWSGKCDSGADFSPAETGEILARLVVGAPSITVYLDPQIRTA